MKKIIIYLLFSLCFTVCFSQIALPKFSSSINEKDINEKDLEEVVKIDSINNLIFVLGINNCVLDSIIRDKISYLNKRRSFKNINIYFLYNGEFDYIAIEGNNPYPHPVDKSLFGTMMIDDYRLFVYNYSGISIDDYFYKTDLKYFVKQEKILNMTITCPIWYYAIVDGALLEAKARD